MKRRIKSYHGNSHHGVVPAQVSCETSSNIDAQDRGDERKEDKSPTNGEKSPSLVLIPRRIGRKCLYLHTDKGSFGVTNESVKRE